MRFSIIKSASDFLFQAIFQKYNFKIEALHGMTIGSGTWNFHSAESNSSMRESKSYSTPAARISLAEKTIAQRPCCPRKEGLTPPKEAVAPMMAQKTAVHMIAQTDSPANDRTQTVLVKLERISFEQQFGARLPVWIGGVALALAGFFMVKYSIEAGFLSPAVRVVLGIIFGAGLLCAATWLRAGESSANSARIAQALSGAGIADLYVYIFAATNLYDLVPGFIAFSGMALVTAAAVVFHQSFKTHLPITLRNRIFWLFTPVQEAHFCPLRSLLNCGKISCRLPLQHNCYQWRGFIQR